MPPRAPARRAELPVLTRREQNRALLARQLLLERDRVRSAEGTIEHLVGLQAQSPKDPYFALWSRLERFDPTRVGWLLTERRAVRMTLMRATVHLVTISDAHALRPLLQPSIERSFKGAWGRRIDGVDLEALTTAARQTLAQADAPLTGRELAARVMSEHAIAGDAEAIRHAINVRLPLVQVPPRGVWGSSGQPKYAALDVWADADADQQSDAAADQQPDADADQQSDAEPITLDAAILRYLGSFGPASVADFQKWSGLTRCAPAFDRLRPQLLRFRSETNRELFDLPGAPRPDADTHAPVRFLPEYDNLFLSHADREHVIPNGETPWLGAIEAGRHVGNVLVGGMLRATWWIEDAKSRAGTLMVRPLDRVTETERTELQAEAERLAAFAGATGVRIDDGTRMRTA